MTSVRFPVAILPRFKCTADLFADMSNRPVLCCRRLLANERTFTVPGDIVCARPTVAASHVAAILDRERRLHVVEQTARGPAVVRLATRERIARVTKHKSIRSADTTTDNKIVSAAFGLAS